MQAQTESGGVTFRDIPLAQLTASPTNPRKVFAQDSLDALADSIRQRGVLQPIVVRPTTNEDGRAAVYEIVAGERRFRAARLAGLNDIPARVEAMSDEEVLQVQIIENLQREGVHPLDEAEGFRHLKEAARLDITETAQRIAKDVRYVARRLALINLIEEAKADFRQERITLAHALEICPLAPEIQRDALAACFEPKHVWNQCEQTHTRVPDKEKPARHVRHLQDWIAQNVHLNLHKAPFKMDDTRLREDGLTCIACPQRTGFNVGLFADVKNTDTCLNPACFKTKLQAFVQITKAELDAKRDTPTPYISTYYSYDSRVQAENVLTRSQYQLLEKRVDRCEYAERAIYVDGAEVGQVRWICREAKCKDHLGRYYIDSTSSSGSSSGASTTSTSGTVESRNKRKQELFDIRVDEIARKRVMSEALKTYKFPVERAHLNEVAKEFFRRIPSDDQRTILEVLGWDEKEVRDLRVNSDKVLAWLAKLDNKGVAQFLALCSFAHFGANQYRNARVNQEPVVRLAKERGVNHTLIDAQVRLELVPKKYKAEHQAYLDQVTNGKKAARPVVYEQSPQQQQQQQTSAQQDEPQEEAPATKEATTAAASEASGARRATKGKPAAKRNVTHIRTKKPQPRKQPATQKQMKKAA